MPIVIPEQQGVDLGRSRVIPRDTYVDLRNGAESTYRDSIRKSDQLASALSEFGGSVNAFGKQKEQEDLKQVDALTAQISQSIKDGEPYDVQVGKLLPERSRVVQMGVAEAYGRQRARVDAQEFYQNTLLKLENDPTASEAAIAKFRAEQAKKHAGSPFFNGAYSSELNDQLTKAGNQMSAKRNTAMREVLSQDSKERIYQTTLEAVKGSVDVSKAPDPAKATALANAAKELGIRPIDLAVAMSYETGGKMSADTPGGGAAAGRFGLIQFGPNEAKQYGADPSQPFEQQVEAVKRYLVDRGVRPGMGLLDIYAAINAGRAGRPDLYTFKDSNGDGKTVAERVDLMKKTHLESALKFLGIPTDGKYTTQSGKGGLGVTGAAFKADGVDVKHAFNPDFEYGRAATAGKQDFKTIVLHHAVGTTDKLVQYGQTRDEKRGGAFGYHFYIGEDGSIVQGAPLDKRTNHVKDPGASQRTDKSDINNANAIGITLVNGHNGATPAQEAALKKLVPALQKQFNLDPKSIVGHGELQSDRMSTEGSLAKTFRENPFVQTATTPQAPATTPASGSPDISNRSFVQAAGLKTMKDRVIDPEVINLRHKLFTEDELQNTTHATVSNAEKRDNIAEAVVDIALQTKDPKWLDAVPETMRTPKVRDLFDKTTQSIQTSLDQAAKERIRQEKEARDEASRQWQLEANNMIIEGKDLTPEMIVKAQKSGNPDLIKEYNARREAVNSGLIDPRVENEKVQAVEDKMLAIAAAGGDPRSVPDVRSIYDPAKHAQVLKFAQELTKSGGELSNKFYEKRWEEAAQLQYGFIMNVPNNKDPKFIDTDRTFRRALAKEIAVYTAQNGAPINDSQRMDIFEKAQIVTNRIHQPTNKGGATSGTQIPTPAEDKLKQDAKRFGFGTK